MKNLIGKRKFLATFMALGMITMTFGLIMSAPGVLAAPAIAPIITDATDGIGTIYEDGGAAGVGLVGSAKAWIPGRPIATQQFDLAEMPSELPDSGANLPGNDYVMYDAGNHWALGNGWVSGDNSVWYEELAWGLTYTHNAAVVTTATNYSAAKYWILDPVTPQWDAAPYAVLEQIPTPAYAAGTLNWANWVDPTTAAPSVGWNVYYSDTDRNTASFILDGVAPVGPGAYAIAPHLYYAIEPLWDNTGGTPAQIGFGLFSDPIVGGVAAAALATGPNGTSNNPSPAILYQTSGGPASVDIYWTSNGGTTWNGPSNDLTVDGSHVIGPLADGVYYWAANPVGDPAPVGAAGVEAGPYTLDTAAPTVVSLTPPNAAVGVLQGANVVVQYSEGMDPAFPPLLAQTGGVDPGGWVGPAWSTTVFTGDTATWTHANWNLGDVVQMDVSGGQDNATNAFVGNTVWSFTIELAPNVPPTTTIDTVSVDPYIGVLPDDVILTVTGSDILNEGDNVVAADYQIDGGPWIPMVPGAIGPTTVFTVTIDLHNYSLAAHPINARSYDAGVGPVAGPYAYNVGDTTVPVGLFQAPTPADNGTRDTGLVVPINVRYIDFTEYTTAVYYTQDAPAGIPVAWSAATPMTDNGWFLGSNEHDFGFTITLGVDGYVNYYVELTDGNGNIQTIPPGGAGAPRVLNFLTAAAVVDPYPIYGYTTYYNGVAGVMEFNPVENAYGRLDPTSAVTITWINSTTGAPSTIATVSNAFSQFSVDILNYTDGGIVWVNGTSAGWGNNGYNYTTIDIVGAPGGIRQDVMFGVPYEVVYSPPIVPLTNVIAGSLFNVDYAMWDRDGMIAQGYFTYVADGPMDFYSGDLSFVNDIAHPLAYDGLGGAVTDGFAVAQVVFITGGNQWVNISEGGAAPTPDGPDFLTPWGAFLLQDGGLLPGYLDDWENVTIFVTSDFFQWNIQPGWNAISVPMIPDDPGTILSPLFSAFDIINETEEDLGLAAYTTAMRTGGNPSTYTTFDAGMPETGAGADFTTDYTSGYWLFSPGPAGAVSIAAQNNTNWGVDNIGAIAVGWNFIGFTHNYSVAAGSGNPGDWTNPLAADDFRNGAMDTSAPDWEWLVIGDGKVVITWWGNAAQWYDSYVYTDTFPGMASHNWVVDTTFAWGYWIWSDSGGDIIFNTDY